MTEKTVVGTGARVATLRTTSNGVLHGSPWWLSGIDAIKREEGVTSIRHQSGWGVVSVFNGMHPLHVPEEGTAAGAAAKKLREPIWRKCLTKKPLQT